MQLHRFPCMVRYALLRSQGLGTLSCGLAGMLAHTAVFLLQVATPELHETAAAQQPQQQQAADGQEQQQGDDMGRLLRLATVDGAPLQQ